MGAPTDPARAFVAREELRPLWQRLHDRLGAGGPVTSVRVEVTDAAGAEALAELLGWAARPPMGPCTVAVARLDEALVRAGLPPAARLVTELLGPVTDRRAIRAARVVEREAMWGWLASHPTVTRLGLASWVDQVRSGGLTGTPAQGRTLLEAVLAVLGELPTESEPLAALAGRILGDPHALDDGRRVATLVLRAAAVHVGSAPPSTAAGRRDLWARMGVRTDELSSTILLAGRWRPPRELGGSGPRTQLLAELLAATAPHSQALPATLGMVRASEAPEPAAGVLHVVENPTVMAAALAHLGPDCPALACIAGWPSVAAVQLLERLRAAGAVLRYHGDIDADGLRIAGYMIGEVGAQPWRMSAADYLGGLPPSPGTSQRIDLARLPPVSWDPDLASAIRVVGRPLYEEQVLAALMADLAAVAG